MSFEKLQTDIFCVGWRHRSATAHNVDDITSKVSKVFFGCCLVCNRKEFMTVNDNTIAAEVLGDFFKSLCKRGLILSRSMTKQYFKKTRKSFGDQC